MLSWKIEIYDIAGNVAGSVTKEIGGPFTLHGSPDVFHPFIHELTGLPAFFADPESTARQAYKAYIQQFPTTGGDPTWEELCTDPAKQPIAHRWLSIGRAANRSNPAAN